MRANLLLIPACALLLLSACTAKPATSAAPADLYRPTATVKDIMAAEVMPSAMNLWDAVSSTVDEKGITDKAPHTDDEWDDVRDHAVTLLEATNLLLVPGRHVAKPGEKADDPKVELSGEQIQDLIDKDRDSWVKFAHGLHDAVMPAFQAIEAKNVQGLFDAGDKIDKACEDCHLKYWYPNENKQNQDGKASN
jgi:hypothetical protein